MVVGVFPVAKLGALLLRQISKPIANFVKERAKHNYFFRTYVCMPPAQFYNWCEVRIKMWYMGMGKPDSIPRLNEQMAIELGSNLLGEAIVFVTAAGVILWEYKRQVRREDQKEESRKTEIEEIKDKHRDLENKYLDLYFQVQVQDAETRRVLHWLAEIDAKTVKLPWKGSVSTKDVEVTKETSAKANEAPDNPGTSPTDKTKVPRANITNEEKKR